MTDKEWAERMEKALNVRRWDEEVEHLKCDAVMFEILKEHFPETWEVIRKPRETWWYA